MKKKYRILLIKHTQFSTYLYIDDNGVLDYTNKLSKGDGVSINCELVIISDNRARPNEWYAEFNALGTKVMEICKAPSIIPGECELYELISSSNPQLNLPLISKSFIEYYIKEYNKGNIIEEVEIEMIPNDRVFNKGNWDYIPAKLKTNQQNEISIII